MAVIMNTIIGQTNQWTQAEVIKKLCDMKHPAINGIEFRMELFSKDFEEYQAEINQYQQAKDDMQWEYYLSIPADFIVDKAINPAFYEGLELAKLLHCRNVKMTIGDYQVIKDIEFRRVTKQLDEYQISLTLENDQSTTTGNPDIIREVLETLNQQELSVGLTFDTGNWLIAGENIVEAFHTLKDDIKFLHIKNIYENQETSLFEDGIIDITKYMGDYPNIIEYAMDYSLWAKQIEIIAES
ncbi:TIM barrel protein [Aerococcaceae bacterium DSM 111020]|nr:TIM barrel protein [Aerococcaceae bacterium DSM 111020]